MKLSNLAEAREYVRLRRIYLDAIEALNSAKPRDVQIVIQTVQGQVPVHGVDGGHLLPEDIVAGVIGATRRHTRELLAETEERLRYLGIEIDDGEGR